MVDINQNDPWSLRIRINPHKDGRTSSNCLVENNIALSFAIDADGKNITLYDNTTLDKATDSATMDSMFEDPARCDFLVKDPALKQLPGHTY